MSDKPLSVWCVSDGRTGIERQTLAVAAALSELTPIVTKIVRLTPRAPQVWLPPSLWPAPLAALPLPEQAQLRAPWPDVWIANGRRSIPYSLQVRKWSGGASFVVQLQNPRLDLNKFDMVVPPRHDQVKGPNVVETFAAPVWYSQADIETASRKIAQKATADRQRVLVILGGASKRHQFSKARADALVKDLVSIARDGHQLWITTSRRTPIGIAETFRLAAKDLGASFFQNEDRDGPNPYLGWLAQADLAIVTEDSTNMITDAAFFGLPIHLVKLEGGDAKFDGLHQAFVEVGAARWFQGRLEHWTYTPIRDARFVAEAVLERLAARRTV